MVLGEVSGNIMHLPMKDEGVWLDCITPPFAKPFRWRQRRIKESDETQRQCLETLDTHEPCRAGELHVGVQENTVCFFQQLSGPKDVRLSPGPRYLRSCAGFRTHFFALPLLHR